MHAYKQTKVQGLILMLSKRCPCSLHVPEHASHYYYSSCLTISVCPALPFSQGPPHARPATQGPSRVQLVPAMCCAVSRLKLGNGNSFASRNPSTFIHQGDSAQRGVGSQGRGLVVYRVKAWPPAMKLAGNPKTA